MLETYHVSHVYDSALLYVVVPSTTESPWCICHLDTPLISGELSHFVIQAQMAGMKHSLPLTRLCRPESICIRDWSILLLLLLLLLFILAMWVCSVCLILQSPWVHNIIIEKLNVYSSVYFCIFIYFFFYFFCCYYWMSECFCVCEVWYGEMSTQWMGTVTTSIGMALKLRSLSSSTYRSYNSGSPESRY